MMTKNLYTLLLALALTLTANAQSRYAEHSRLATGKWMKIRVADEGVYQLTSNDLKSMGFNNPDKVSLYGYNLPILPEGKIERLDDDLTEIPLYRKSDGTLLFYSFGTTRWNRKSTSSPYTHRNNPYTKYIYYFLTESSTTPAEFSKVDATTTSTTPQTTYKAHALHEEDAFSYMNAGRTFFEQYDYANGPTKTYNLTFENQCSGDIILEVRFGTNEASTLEVSSAGDALGTITLPAPADQSNASATSKTFTLYDQTASSMSVTLKHSRASGVTGHLDYIKASYEAKLSMEGKDYLAFNPIDNEVTAIELQGANAATSIWNLTAPAAPYEMTGTLTGTTYLFGTSGARFTEQYVAVNTNATFPTPQAVGVIANQDLHALDSISLLIIVPTNGRLTAQAQRLADAHTAIDSIRCAVVTAEQVYNEFSSGTPDATAYRRLMKMLYDKQYTASPLTGTEPGNLNILLFGNCVWDHRFVTSGLKSKSEDDYLLAYESDNSWSHTDSYVLEEYFTLLADGKGVSPLKEVPDCGVGRIPVSTEQEAKIVVDKLIAYMNHTDAGAWQNTVCIMGDDGDENVHMTDAKAVYDSTKKLFPDYRYKCIYWDSYTRQQTATGNSFPDVYAEINKVMQEGALIMNYTGHGSAYMLSHEQVLKIADFQKWDSPRLPLWLTAACDVAPFDMNIQNLACEALLNKQGGAMGFIGTARTVFSSPNQTLNRNFMSHVLAKKKNGESYTIGEALAQAKADILTSKRFYSKNDTINKTQFVLLGDPAIKLPQPIYKVLIDQLNGEDIDTKNPPTISAGATVTVKGHIADTEGTAITNFDGTVTATVYDNEQHIVCKNAAGAKEAFEYDDRTRTLYAGTDSVIAGNFTFTFPVPLDINYSDLQGQIILAAITHDKTAEANGTFYDFLVGGTSEEELTDTIGPSITAYSDGANMTNLNYTDETPTLRLELYDDSGINTTGNGLGHDIVAIIDGSEATTYTLNSYYTQSIGDYRSGTVEYTIPTALEAGKHTLVVRAFDTLNNIGEATYIFEVAPGLRKEYEIFDMSGRKILNTYGTTLPKGIYIRRTRLTSDNGTIRTTSEKFIITQ